jgi:NadR type nicotinamide-nucleotide adenylyltransferase
MYRIAITGPESSGKSVLAKALADVLNACLVEEYARSYLENKAALSGINSYNLSELITMGKEQYNQNLGVDCLNDYLVCDTEMSVFKVWCIDKFGHFPEELNELFLKQKFDLYVLCKPDFPWESDPLREDEGRREELFARYIQLFEKGNESYIIAKGDIKDRLEAILVQLSKNNPK